MTTRRILASALGATAAILVCAVTASAEVDYGLRVGYYTDAEDAFIGGEVLLPLSDSVRLNPNAEYVLSKDRDQYDLSLDAIYIVPSERSYYLWLGGGATLFTVNDHTDVFTNFVTGIGLTRESVVPYFQLKIVAKDDAEIVLAFGVRF
jgi:hypothetical protein